ncbi:hypothetical protein ACFL47_03095 [Candidatus Latescibacterota bacterium]
MKNISLYIVLALFFMTLPCEKANALNESEAATLYNHAGAQYREGMFNEALEMYEQLIAGGVVNPDLFYNAANTAYRTDSIGKAVLYLERALRLDPSDEDAIANLAFINSIKQDREPVNDNPVVAFIVGHYDAVNSNSAARWSGISFAVAMLLVTALLFTSGLKRLAAGGAGIVFVLIFLVTTGTLIDKVHHGNTVKEAVIMTESAKAFSGPGGENTHIFTVHEGTKVVIERQQNVWNLIRLKSGAGGWIQAELMERI